MKKIFFSMLGLGFFTTISLHCLAQDTELTENNNGEINKDEEIIIHKKGGKDSKITLEMKGDDVLINGKPSSEYHDGDISVIRRKGKGLGEDDMFFGPADRRGMQIFSDEDMKPKAFLGVTSEKDDKGVKISKVSAGSAAEKAGLKTGDIITKVGDKEINDPGELIDAVTAHKPKEEVKISYLRNGKSGDAKATLGERKSTHNYFSFNNSMPKINGPVMKDFKFDMPFAYNGDQPFEKFWMGNNKKIGVRVEDTEDDAGAKITNVEEGSAADKAGLKKDDIITEVNGDSVKDASDVKEKILGTEKNNFTVKAKRGSSVMNFDIKIPKKMNSENL